MTTQQKPRRAPIRRTLTPLQKKREITLVVLGVEKTEIARKIGVTAQLIANIFNDRHRSPDVEQSVVKYLNKKLTEGSADSWEYDTLNELDMLESATGRITAERMGWPKP